MKKKPSSDIGKIILMGNYVDTQPRRRGKLLSRYPGTMSGDLIEHILTWLHGDGSWKDQNGVFKNW